MRRGTSSVFRSLMLLFLILQSAGCASYGRWHEVEPESVIWSGPDAKARQIRREFTPSYLDPRWPQKGYQFRWVDTDGRHYESNRIVQDADSYLASTDIMAHWPLTHSYVGSFQQRLAPYRFFIVSVDPVVAIMVPHDYGSLENRSINDILGDEYRGLRGSRLMNEFVFGNRFPYHIDLKWFSPDGKVGPAEVPGSGPIRQIPLTSDVLVLEKQDNEWVVRRTR